MLDSLPGTAFCFVLVLSRVGTAVMLLPGLGEAEPPPMLRAGLALALTILLLPAVASRVPDVPDGLGGAGMIAAELMAGAILGWLARLPAMALSMAGAVISTMTGLTSVVQPDPALGGQSSALARALGLAVPVLVLSSGLYALPLSALAGSYQLVPPGGDIPGDIVESVQQAVSGSFGLSLRLSAPFLLAGVLFQTALGLMGRLAPQLQVMAASAPGQILGGMVLLGGLGQLLLSTWSETLRSAWSSLPGL